MANYEWSTREAIGDIGRGLKVEATTYPIVTGQNAVFTIGGGRILLLDLVGLVTVQLEAAALLLHWDCDMDIGGDAALSIDSADLTGDVIGTQYLMPAAAGGALTVPAGGAYLRLFPALGWVISAGALDLHASAGNTGGIKWTAFYYPLDDGAYLQAA
jgi:hypothetical protein